MEAKQPSLTKSGSKSTSEEMITKNKHIYSPSNHLFSHRLGAEIESILQQQIHYAKQGISDQALGWKLITEDEEMILYRREEETNSALSDPIKAYLTIEGLTGFEVCHFFFSPKYRYDWDNIVDKMVVLEEIDESTLIFMQRYKKFFLASQRDSVFWSHIRSLESTNKTEPNQWVVVNHSTEHPMHTQGADNCIRINLVVCLFCQTIINPSTTSCIEGIARDDIKCRVTYCAKIEPGGWTSPAILRPFYKREYPKFLRNFISFVKQETKDVPIKFG